MKLATLFLNALRGLQEPIISPVQSSTCPLEFSASWEVIGPFQVGTRGMVHPLPLDASETDTAT
jgi:hypothetical protein